LARWLPSGVLVLVALHQLYLAHAVGLSPWFGGGFGMFSSADAGRARHVHAFVMRPGLEREVFATEEIAELETRARTLPSDTNLQALGRALAELPSPDHGPATGVRVQVWRTRYDAETLAPESQLLRGLVVAVPP
jgi:hypothetical protein